MDDSSLNIMLYTIIMLQQQLHRIIQFNIISNRYRFQMSVLTRTFYYFTCALACASPPNRIADGLGGRLAGRSINYYGRNKLLRSQIRRSDITGRRRRQGSDRGSETKPRPDPVHGPWIPYAFGLDHCIDACLKTERRFHGNVKNAPTG